MKTYEEIMIPKFVRKHRVAIAYTTGVVVGVGVMIFAVNSKTMIHITPSDARRIKDGSSVLYETRHGILKVTQP